MRALRRLIISCAVLAASALLTGALSDPGEPLRTKVTDAKTLLESRDAAARERTGFAEQLRTRLIADIGLLNEAVRPAWSSEDEFWTYNAALVDLDLSLVREATANTPLGLPLVRPGFSGAGFLKSPAGGPAQPVAVYVSAHYSPAEPAPLIVMLHGGGQTETQLLAFDALRRLAERSGSILIAPWAHGEITAFDAAYQSDVDAATDAARAAYSVDIHRVYLFGVSAGAFGAFHAALAHPKRWAGILAVGGTLGTEDTPQAATFRDKRIYVVSGLADPVIPNAFVRKTIAFMRGSGLHVAYYEETLGEHSLHSVLPSVERAWQDMLSGAMPAGPLPTPSRSAAPGATPSPGPSGSAPPPTPLPSKTQAP